VRIVVTGGPVQVPLQSSSEAQGLTPGASEQLPCDSTEPVAALDGGLVVNAILVLPQQSGQVVVVLLVVLLVLVAVTVVVVVVGQLDAACRAHASVSLSVSTRLGRPGAIAVRTTLHFRGFAPFSFVCTTIEVSGPHSALLPAGAGRRPAALQSPRTFIFCIPFTVTRFRSPGAQEPSASGSFRQARILKVQLWFAVASPSPSQVGSQSLHVRVLPSSNEEEAPSKRARHSVVSSILAEPCDAPTAATTSESKARRRDERWWRVVASIDHLLGWPSAWLFRCEGFVLGQCPEVTHSARTACAHEHIIDACRRVERHTRLRIEGRARMYDVRASPSIDATMDPIRV
jgi:hypothetical protein